MNEDVIPRTESSAVWRAANSARFPVLAVEAKRYLSAPPTSVASEDLTQFGGTSIISTDALVLCPDLTYNAINNVAVATRCENKPSATSESMIKWLTAVARLACIVHLNHDWNAAFSRP